MTKEIDIQIFIDNLTRFSSDRLETLVREIEVLKTIELKYEVPLGSKLRKDLDRTVKSRAIRVKSREGVFCYEIGDYAIHQGQFIQVREDGYRFNDGKPEEDVYFGGMFLPLDK